MRYKTKSGKTLALFGKSKDETKLRVPVGMRLPLSVYKKNRRLSREMCSVWL